MEDCRSRPCSLLRRAFDRPLLLSRTLRDTRSGPGHARGGPDACVSPAFPVVAPPLRSCASSASRKRRPLSIAFQMVNLPCQLPPLPRDLNEGSFYVRILRLRSQPLTFFRLIKVSFDPRIQTAARRFLKASWMSTIPPSRLIQLKNPERLHLGRI